MALYDRAARRAGLETEAIKREIIDIPSLVLPAVLIMKDGTALILLGIDPTKKSAKVLDPLVKRPDAPVDAILLRAALSDRAGDQKTSEELYRRGLKIRPDQPEALNNLGVCLLEAGQVAQALAALERALATRPAYAEALNNRGNALQQLDPRPAADLH